MSSLSVSSVKEQLSGEKLRRECLESGGHLKVSSWLRVAASRTTTHPFVLTAMNSLHGDHMIPSIDGPRQMVATIGSHESGSPFTILTRELACCLYSPCMIDVEGDRASAD